MRNHERELCPLRLTLRHHSAKSGFIVVKLKRCDCGGIRRGSGLCGRQAYYSNPNVASLDDSVFYDTEIFWNASCFAPGCIRAHIGIIGFGTALAYCVETKIEFMITNRRRGIAH